MGHQRPRGDNHIEPAPVDHVTKHEAHLGNTHGPGKRPHHRDPRVLDHGRQDLGRLT